ncbi:protein ENHANCED DOWNY MILDEW 2-like [Zingiber officinale]|uniref:protein ENHANCED DOWNY MILDEW 2-like n=1 Tax=Zingiber officinale TaxID=94328 RepID=UPI001C4AE5A4|nr:protein ENHANCED DOWNY MILDEW 2-like [Zingiber officinale]
MVDFRCGANDFSILMKEKLDSAGKKCNFKNYDIIQPKNDFNFERRDWMTELPTGSKLIMGLNPPFGVKAALANKFIDHALKFKPKLVILIVPKETERLDKKQSKYDLIWEDSQSLSGKSFYLPGSVDVNDNQLEQWNLSPPPLNLWSRDDWTVKHKRIAARQGHIVEDQGPPFRKGILSEKPVDSLPAEDHTEAEILVKDATLEEKKARDENHKSSDGTKRKISPGHASTISRKRRRKKKGQAQEERKNDVELSDMSILPDQNRNTPSHLPLEPSSVAPQERDSHLTTGVEFSFKAGGGPASSVMDRYAPHLDMTKYARPISEVPFGQFPGRSDPYDYNIHGARRDQANFPRFPSGPHSSSSSRGNSCGWID